MDDVYTMKMFIEFIEVEQHQRQKQKNNTLPFDDAKKIQKRMTHTCYRCITQFKKKIKIKIRHKDCVNPVSWRIYKRKIIQQNVFPPQIH